MIGTSLSHYRIVDKLSAEGMGEVCRAEDTNLDRHVAIMSWFEELKLLAPAAKKQALLTTIWHPQRPESNGGYTANLLPRRFL